MLIQSTIVKHINTVQIRLSLLFFGILFLLFVKLCFWLLYVPAYIFFFMIGKAYGMSFLPDALLTARGRKKQRSQQNSLRLHCFLCASHCVSNLYVNAVYNIFPDFVSLFFQFFHFRKHAQIVYNILICSYSHSHMEFHVMISSQNFHIFFVDI